MSGMLKRLNRGSSVLAALVFVGLLSVAALAVQSFDPTSGVAVNGASQGAQAAAPTAAAKKPGVKLDDESPKRCIAPIVAKKGPKEGQEGVKNVCVPGCTYDIKVQSSGVIIGAEDTCAKLLPENTDKL